MVGMMDESPLLPEETIPAFVDLDALSTYLLGSSPLLMALTEGGSHVLRGVSTPFLRLLGKPGEAVLGRPLADTSRGSALADYLPLLDLVYGVSAGENGSGHGHARAASHGVYGTLTAWPLAVVHGRPRGLVLLLSTDGPGTPTSPPTATDPEAREVAERLAISAIREQDLADELRDVAFHDALTGLPNRALLIERMDRAISAARRAGKAVALLYLDMDQFKAINDTFGHRYGDLFLREVGPRVSGVLRDMDTVARMGGDEFAVLLPEVADAEAAGGVARKVAEALALPFPVEGRNLHLEASIGSRCSPTTERTSIP